MFKKLLISFCIIILVLGGYYWKKEEKTLHRTEKTQVNTSLPLVRVGKIETVPFVLTEEYIGYVSAIKSVEVRPYISGFVDKVFVNGGQHITKGDPLFLLQQTEYIAHKYV